MQDAGVGEVVHAVDVLCGGQTVADLILVGLEMLGKRPEHQTAVDGIILVDGLDLGNQVFLAHILGQDKLLHLDADELSTSRRALFIGQVGGVLAAADDRQLRGNAFFLQSGNTRLKLFIHRSGNFFTKQ